MKRNDIRALHDKTIAELQQQARDLKKQQVKARLDLAANKLSDTRQPSKLADDTARVQTVLSEKQLLAAVEAELSMQKGEK